MLTSQRPKTSDMSVGLLCTYSQQLDWCYTDQFQRTEYSSSPLAKSLSPDVSTISWPEPQSVSLTPGRSHSPESTNGSGGSCVTQHPRQKRPKMRKFERKMPRSDPVINDCGRMESRLLVMEATSRRNVKQMLRFCGKAVSENNMAMVEYCMDELRLMVSVWGNPVERLGAYMLEGLVARLSSTGTSLYKASRQLEPAKAELLAYLYEICPCVKFGHMSANGAIAEAMKDESQIHIIDFGIGQGGQWAALIEALGARPGGPPHVRITGIFDTLSYAHGDSSFVSMRLTRFAQKCNVSLHYDSVVMTSYEIQLEDLDVQRGVALAVNFGFMLHHVPDESVSTHNHRDRLLRLVKSLSPKIVTLVEQELNTNTAPYLQRFYGTMDYYDAVFDSIDTMLPRNHRQRINVEQHCFARNLVNIIACEGAERIERHEVLGKWKSRFMMAGFKPYPLSREVNSAIKSLIHNHNQKYRFEESDGASFLGWKDRNLVSSSAWKCNLSTE